MHWLVKELVSAAIVLILMYVVTLAMHHFLIDASLSREKPTLKGFVMDLLCSFCPNRYDPG